MHNALLKREGKTMLKLFDIVTLRNDDSETGIKAGTEGTIVDILGNGKAFTKCAVKPLPSGIGI